jgi:hypothetical protein
VLLSPLALDLETPANAHYVIAHQHSRIQHFPPAFPKHLAVELVLQRPPGSIFLLVLNGELGEGLSDLIAHHDNLNILENFDVIAQSDQIVEEAFVDVNLADFVGFQELVSA